ncbi:hypothetical protein [Kallotenue papyrolyticum]|uniref:hypothetical protein n=1 Tax=Kallotenue papyrolyticum TaxID=1325125 RepID=UPI000492DC77|nr:hypothetical protein [Kallotenue papyrolyticum]
MTADTLLDQAKAALRAGERETARRLLLQLTEAAPERVDGWLWLAAASTDADWKRTYLERVLRLDPGNALALAGLRALGVTLPAAPSRSPASPATTLPQAPRPAVPEAALPLGVRRLTFHATGARGFRLSWTVLALLGALLALIPLVVTLLRL